MEILKAELGEGNLLLTGKVMLDGFAEMSFTLRDSKYGPFFQLTKSFKGQDGKFVNQIWLNRNQKQSKALEILEARYRELMKSEGARLDQLHSGSTDVLDRVRGDVEVEIIPAKQEFTADDIPF